MASSMAVIHKFPFSSSSSSSSHSVAASSPKPNPPFRNQISRKHLVVNQIQNQGFRVSSPTRFYGLSASNSINGTCFNGKGVSEIGIREKGFDHFRVSSVSDGGGGGGMSGAAGGGGGGFGDGNSSGNGGGGDEDGGSNWSLLSWYLGLLEAFPVLTKAVTSALLNLIGDLTCQIFIEKASTVDLKRTFMFTFLGFALVGPTLHFWYLYLSKLVTVPGATGASLRLLLDQFLFSPIFVGVFLSALVTLEGNPSQVVPKLQQEWFSAVLANWQLWIPFQFLNFRFVPQNFQVLAANVVALAWNVILSFKAHKQIITK